MPNPSSPAPSRRAERRQAQRRAAKEVRRRQAAKAQRRQAQRAQRRLVVTALVLVAVALAVGIPIALAPPAPVTVNVTTLVRAPAVSALAEGLGSGWLTNDRSDVLERFSPTTGRLIGASVKLSGRPVAVTVAFGRVWVLSMITNQVEEVNPATMAIIDRISVPESPSDIVAADGRLYVACVVAGKIAVIDPGSHQVLRRVAVRDGTVRLAAGFGSVWTTGTGDEVTALSLSSTHYLAQRTYRVGKVPLGIAVGDGAVWSANASSSSISRIDPVTGAVTNVATQGDPVGIAVVGDQVFTANGNGPLIEAVGKGAKAVGKLIGEPRGMIAVGNVVWVPTANPGSVSVGTLG